MEVLKNRRRFLIEDFKTFKIHHLLEQHFRGLSWQTNKNIVVAYLVIKFYLGMCSSLKLHE
jgi:hypothetical protein